MPRLGTIAQISISHQDCKERTVEQVVQILGILEDSIHIPGRGHVQFIGLVLAVIQLVSSKGESSYYGILVIIVAIPKH